MATLTLVCSTKGRPNHVARRVPLWVNSGIDRVIVVDATANPEEAAAVERSCKSAGATYIYFPSSPWDTRAKQRNLGARTADTDWILFQDDDDDIIAEFDHSAFDLAVRDTDYLWDGRGLNLVYHRRENFLRLGGYPEDMAIGVDTAISWLVRATSRGGLEGPLYRRLEPAGNPVEVRRTNVRRAAAMFWYGVTFPRYLERTPPSLRRNTLSLSMLTYRTLWGEPAYRQTAPLGLLVYTIGLILGIPWHWIRKAYDPRFRGNLRMYRDALASGRFPDDPGIAEKPL